MEEKKIDTEKLISVIIINWNGEKFLTGCIESVKAQSYTPIEIILVDNASTDNSLTGISREIILVKNEKNLGYCGASNIGIKTSKGGIIILLNQDVILEKHYAGSVYEIFKRNETAGIVSGKILRMDKKTIDSAGQFMNKWAGPVERGYNLSDKGQFIKEDEIFSVCGASACYRRKMLEEIKIDGQYFDEEYFAFNEDLDLGWRARIKGWKAFYNPGAVSYHYRGGTVKKKRSMQILGREKDIRHRIIFNRYLTIIKNISKTHFLLYLPFFLARGIIDLLFILFFIRDTSGIFNEFELIRSAWRKRAFIQAAKTVPDRDIRKYII